MLDVPIEKLKAGLLSPIIGNTYSGASPLGLCAVLDVAKAGDKILVTSYGSGSGSDSFAFSVTDKIKDVQKLATTTAKYIEKKQYIDYATYIKYRGKINM
jgi:hydroxymethylglutaryl-CoA synthase